MKEPTVFVKKFIENDGYPSVGDRFYDTNLGRIELDIRCEKWLGIITEPKWWLKELPLSELLKEHGEGKKCKHNYPEIMDGSIHTGIYSDICSECGKVFDKQKGVDVEKLAEKYAKELIKGGAIKDWQESWMQEVYKYIYNQALQSNDKKFSLEDVRSAIRKARLLTEDKAGEDVSMYSEDYIIQSLTTPNGREEGK